jgi:hypothetical protein
VANRSPVAVKVVEGRIDNDLQISSEGFHRPYLFLITYFIKNAGHSPSCPSRPRVRASPGRTVGARARTLGERPSSWNGVRGGGPSRRPRANAFVVFALADR